jgi:hypothetical protein
MKQLLVFFFFTPLILLGQSKKQRKALEAQRKADQQMITDMKNHIGNLSSITTGDSMALYISSHFASVGLKPKGTEGFFHKYVVNAGRQIDDATYLKVNDSVLALKTEYFPLQFSAQKKVSGMPAMALRERGVPWFTDLKHIADLKVKKGQALQDAIVAEAAKVAGKGATALFVYNTSPVTDNLSFQRYDNPAPTQIPVVYLTQEALKKHFKDHSDILDIELNVSIKEVRNTETNVVGYVDNGAANTVIISAPYKVYQGENSGNTSKTFLPVEAALLIVEAKMLNEAKAKNNNYLFVASPRGKQDEDGLLNLLASNSSSTNYNYLIRMDNVRIATPAKGFDVRYIANSSAWSELLPSVKDELLQMKIDSITGISALFNLPALGLQSNDVESHDSAVVNYESELALAKYVMKLVDAADGKGKLPFIKPIAQSEGTVSSVPTKAPEEKPEIRNNTSAVKTTVSLGVIPDKESIGNGMKINGVSPKKLAAQIGLKAGDIITGLGTFPIIDVGSYREALSRFKAGDKTILKIKRGKEDKEFPVVF